MLNPPECSIVKINWDDPQIDNFNHPKTYLYDAYTDEYHKKKKNLIEYARTDNFKKLTPFCQQIFIGNYSSVAIGTLVGNRIIYNRKNMSSKLFYESVIFVVKMLVYHFTFGIIELMRDYIGADAALSLFPIVSGMVKIIYLPLIFFHYMLYLLKIRPNIFIILTDSFYYGACDSIHHILSLIHYIFLFPGYHTFAKVGYHLLHWFYVIPMFVELFSDMKSGVVLSLLISEYSENLQFIGHTLRKKCCRTSN